MGRIRRWYAERYRRPIYGGSDPTDRDLLLEAFEVRIWEAGEDPAAPATDGERPDGAPKKVPSSGDPLIDAMIAQVMAGEDVDLDLI